MLNTATRSRRAYNFLANVRQAISNAIDKQDYVQPAVEHAASPFQQRNMTDEVLHFADDHRQALEPFLPDVKPPRPEAGPNKSPSPPAKPHVTLTYATSLDSAIAAAPGQRTSLSGKESKSMTHYLRTRHDAILIGYGTAKADDPTLNSRLEGASLDDQPQPCIIDGHATWNPDESAKIVQAAKTGRGKIPWRLVPKQNYKTDSPNAHVEDVILSNPTWPGILESLASRGIQSVMIEGGAHIIRDLLSNHLHVIDSLVVTVAPVMLGDGSLKVESKAVSNDRLQHVRWMSLGRDGVMCASLSTE